MFHLYVMGGWMFVKSVGEQDCEHMMSDQSDQENQ